MTGSVEAARNESLAAPEGTEQQVGTTRRAGWVRYYAQMRDLVATLQDNGFDVRIVSACWSRWCGSGRHVGISADRAMGTAPNTTVTS